MLKLSTTQSVAHGDNGRLATVPSDRAEATSYALQRIGALQAHARGPTGRGNGVTVAVIDGGIDVNHPDLEDAFIWSPGVDRKTASPRGYDGASGTSNVRPRLPQGGSLNLYETRAGRATGLSHGTHVSGIIAARRNGQGVVGVAPEARLLPIRMLLDGTPITRTVGSITDPSRPLSSGQVSQEDSFAHLTRLMKANNVFVVNNSWALRWKPNLVDITHDDGRKGYFLQPLVAREGYQTLTTDMFAKVTKTGFNDLGAVFVFGVGNDGWNSETGEVEIYSEKLTNLNDYVNPSKRKAPVYMRANAAPIARTGTPANLPGPFSSAFLGSPELKGIWLAVVATDRNDRITPFSNGCGEAMEYCLAAPGAFVVSSVYSEDGNFYSPREQVDYALMQGTSMAAPMVSGAVAVLKSLHPNLNARQIVKILLDTATDRGAPGTDPVYGRGLLNLGQALKPIGATNVAGLSAKSIAATTDTRIAFSAAFGDAAPSTPHRFGGLDSYGRVYRYRAALQDKMMTGPGLAGMLEQNKATSPVATDTWRGGTAFIRHSDEPESALGDGTAVSFVGDRLQLDLSVIRRRKSTHLSPVAALTGQDKSLATSQAWGGIALESRDVISGGTRWQLSPGFDAGAYLSRALVDGAARRGKAYGMTDFGFSTRIGNKQAGIEMQLGRLAEEGRFLGSMPEGAYELARPTQSDYLRVSATGQIHPRLSVGANFTRLRSHVDFRHNAFVADTQLSAQMAGAHLAVSDAVRPGDRLVLHYAEPLAVTGGEIRQSSVMGYRADGSYRTEVSALNLAVRRRHSFGQLVYKAPLAPGVTGFAAAAHHRNWSHQSGKDNGLVMIGVTIRP